MVKKKLGSEKACRKYMLNYTRRNATYVVRRYMWSALTSSSLIPSPACLMTKLSRHYLQYFLARHIRYFLYFYSCTRHESFYTLCIDTIYDNQFQNLKKNDTMLQQKVSQRHSSYCSGSKYKTRMLHFIFIPNIRTMLGLIKLMCPLKV